MMVSIYAVLFLTLTVTGFSFALYIVFNTEFFFHKVFIL